MKFIEVNFGLINTAHIISLAPHELPLDCGDFVIEIVLSNGNIILEPEVSYEAMMERYNRIMEELK